MHIDAKNTMEHKNYGNKNAVKSYSEGEKITETMFKRAGDQLKNWRNWGIDNNNIPLGWNLTQYKEQFAENHRIIREYKERL